MGGGDRRFGWEQEGGLEHTLPPSLRIRVRLLFVPQLQSVIEVDERGVGVVVGTPAVAADACGCGIAGPASLPGPLVLVVAESVLLERGLVGSVPESHVCVRTGGTCVQTNEIAAVSFEVLNVDGAVCPGVRGVAAGSLADAVLSVDI